MPASTVAEYLAALPADRREALNEVRRGINRALPPGYKEGIQFGIISRLLPTKEWGALKLEYAMLKLKLALFRLHLPYEDSK
jgi:hypothetical protein